LAATALVATGFALPGKVYALYQLGGSGLSPIEAAMERQS